MDKKTMFFSFFMAELTGRTVDLPKEEVTPQMLEFFYGVAKEHDVTHIMGEALEKAGLLENNPEIAEKFTKQQMLALYRYERLNFEFTRICALFEQEKIAHVPLKGSVLRQYYPKPYMRTSCDIDILIKEEDMERAVAALTTHLGYQTKSGKEFHDIHVYAPSGVHLELHYNIKEDIEPMDSVLLQVWDHVYRAEGSTYHFLQTPEFLYFHQIAHAAYHFSKGGCGIRPAMDVFLLKKKLPCNEKKLDELLKQANLQTFSRAFSRLCSVWFEDETHSALTLEMERYILDGGVYGSVENGVAMGRATQKGRGAYILSRVFVPYKKMRSLFPILRKYPILLPVMHVYRWLRIIFGRRRKLALAIVKSNNTLDEESKDRVTALREDLDLN